MAQHFKRWKLAVAAVLLVLANLSLSATILRAAEQQPGGNCCATCICWCAKAGDVVAMGTCSSLGTGKACGGGNTEGPVTCPN